MGEIGWWGFSPLIAWRKGKVEGFPCFVLSIFVHIPVSPWMQLREHHPVSPHPKKGFINHTFCRNWAVRNLLARLSSLVDKQAANNQLCYILFIIWTTIFDFPTDNHIIAIGEKLYTKNYKGPLHLCPSQKRLSQSRQVVMSPTPTSFVSLLNF